ncbi:MAG: alpha/beta hydrolase [Sphingomonadaceae bacterium]|nr:alpha/beta hydrolase [Sphingomonadaceae bacterium]
MDIGEQARAWKAALEFKQTPQGNIAYRDIGQGKAALFIHGFPLNSFQWRDVVSGLTDDRRCIVPDLLAMGMTEVAEGQQVDFAGQSAMLIALLDGLGIEHFDIVANDSGIGVAQLIAGDHPDRVRTLLLTNGDVEPDSPPEPLLPIIELARAGGFADHFVAASIADKNFTRSAEGLGGLTYTNPERFSDEAIDYYLKPLVESDQRKRLINAYAAAMLPNPLEGIEAKLKECLIPTRIVWGMADIIFKVGDADYLDRLLPGSCGIRRIEGAKLFWPEEFPDIVIEECRILWQQ